MKDSNSAYRAHPIGCEMTRRCVDVTYASRPRFTKPLSAFRLLRHACKSIQTITHPAWRVSAAAVTNYSEERAGPAVRPPARPSRTGPLYSAVNGTSASHFINPVTLPGGGRRSLPMTSIAYRYLAFEPNSLSDAVQWRPDWLDVRQFITCRFDIRVWRARPDQEILWQNRPSQVTTQLPETPSHAPSKRAMCVYSARTCRSSFWNVITYRRQTRNIRRRRACMAWLGHTTRLILVIIGGQWLSALRGRVTHYVESKFTREAALLSVSHFTSIHDYKIRLTTILMRSNTDGQPTLSTVRANKPHCRRETARYFLPLTISLIHSRSLKIIQNGTVERACVSPY